MGSPENKPLEVPPGVVKTREMLAAKGRWIDANWVRFKNGYAEKIGGYLKSTVETFLGVARAIHSWDDLTSRTVTAIATNRRLYAINGSRELDNITPFINPDGTTYSNILSTQTGSPIVRFSITAHNKVSGQGLMFDAPVTIGGLTLSGVYEITSIIDNDHFSITASGNASSTVTLGGGSIKVYYELAPSPVDPAAGFGWGAGAYGEGTYGTPRSVSNATFEPGNWSLDDFGKLLLAAPYGGRLYKWDPTESPQPRATLAAPDEGPGAMRYMFVSADRFVFALGASPDTTEAQDNMLMRWCSQGDFTDWIPTNTNTANLRRLQRGKKLIAGTSFGGQVNLVWSDEACYVVQYTGSRFVHDSRLVGDNCGLAGPHAFALAKGVAYWIGPSGLFYFSGGSVDDIPNADDVKDWVLGLLREFYEVKSTTFFNARYNEIWFLFVENGQTEPSRYCAVNLSGYTWTHGMLTRTAADTSESPKKRPLLAGPDGYVYEHENGVDADGEAIDAYITRAPVLMKYGNQEYEVTGYYPAFERLTGEMDLELVTYESSMDGIVEEATETIEEGAGIVDCRVQGTIVGFTLRSNEVGGDFRLGDARVEVRPAGTRRG